MSNAKKLAAIYIEFLIHRLYMITVNEYYSGIVCKAMVNSYILEDRYAVGD